MNYVIGILTACFSNILFDIFLVALVGYLFGAIKVKGVCLGTAGVFLVALVFGHFGMADESLLHQIGLVGIEEAAFRSNLSFVQNIGLLSFVTSVGFIAGPNFFHNLRKNAKSYVMLAVIIIFTGSLTCVLVTLLTNVDSSMAVGLLSGALTTTPGFAAAQDVVAGNDFLLNEVTVGHAIAYPFGVVGVVLFVQIVPLVLKADMEAERQRIAAPALDDYANVKETETATRSKDAKTGGKGANATDSNEAEAAAGSRNAEAAASRKRIQIDPIGLGAFALAIIIGVFVGKLHFPLPGGADFSLGNTGGALLMALIIGHFGHIGPIDMKINPGFLNAFREFGLCMFLIGAGIPGGSGLVAILQEYGWVLFLYGALMTTIPMIFGYVFARYVAKLALFNNLGSITGGMTSTPALGALINVAKTDDVAASYAATYPVSLILIVLASQFIVMYL